MKVSIHNYILGTTTELAAVSRKEAWRLFRQQCWYAKKAYQFRGYVFLRINGRQHVELF